MPNLPTISQLYEKHGGELLRYFSRRCRSEVADDLLQETFLRVAGQMHRLATVVAPRAWLFGIARHIVAAHYAAQTNRLNQESEPSPSPLEKEDPRLDGMREAIGALPEDRGFSPLQIAASFVAGAAVAMASVYPVLNWAGDPRIPVAEVSFGATASPEPAVAKGQNVARNLPFWSNQRVYLLASRARELAAETAP